MAPKIQKGGKPEEASKNAPEQTVNEEALQQKHADATEGERQRQQAEKERIYAQGGPDSEENVNFAKRSDDADARDEEPEPTSALDRASNLSAAQQAGSVIEPKPSVGRIVLFFAPIHFSQPIAAIITNVHPDGERVNLTVFPPGRDSTFAVNVPKGNLDAKSRCWYWPPRV